MAFIIYLGENLLNKLQTHLIKDDLIYVLKWFKNYLTDWIKSDLKYVRSFLARFVRNILTDYPLNSRSTKYVVYWVEYSLKNIIHKFKNDLAYYVEQYVS